MQLSVIDWWIIIGVLFAVLATGAVVARQAGSSSEQYFLSGRGLPWQLLGLSMVATTFATDTPGLVTDLVRRQGVAGNWAWWAFLLTGMLTVVFFARLWRRSGVTTDLEFYELRYSGKPAAFLRLFRAVYLGVLFNIIVMSTVSLAAIKLGKVMLGLEPLETLLYGALATVTFSTLGGFRAVVLTDALLFGVAMVGSIAAAYFAVTHPAVGGLHALVSNEQIVGKLAMIPACDLHNPDSLNTLVTVLLIPLFVQWWSVWYPGAEPGGGGYLAQRMLAARNEHHAVRAVMFFNVAHYALRPWPWIMVALASLLVYPEVADLRAAFPDVAEDKMGHDLAYAAMLTFLPVGWRGVVIASLLAAYMSTISTHLNWGASYLVNDVYRRFAVSKSDDRATVRVARLCTMVLMIASSVLALWLNTATQGFQLLLQVGAGTGLIYILRWYWWRINAYSEITAMVVSFVVAAGLLFNRNYGLQDWQAMCLGIGITTAAWVLVTLLTLPEPTNKLVSFCQVVQPGGRGWRRIYELAAADGGPISNDHASKSLAHGILDIALGCTAIYGTLFATGYVLYGSHARATGLAIAAATAGVLLARRR